MLAADCEDGVTPILPVPGSVAIWTGADQVSPPGSPLPIPLAVIVRTSSGSPLRGVTVTWAVTAGGGIVTRLTSKTDARGVAETDFILGPNPGEQRATATVEGLTPVTFIAIAQI
jgi:hypothetical protein